MRLLFIIVATGAILASLVFVLISESQSDRTDLNPTAPTEAQAPSNLAAPSLANQEQAASPAPTEANTRQVVPAPAAKPAPPPLAAGITINSLGKPVSFVSLEVIPINHQKPPTNPFATSTEEGTFRFPSAPAVKDFRLRTTFGKFSYMSAIFKAGSTDIVITIPTYTSLQGTFKLPGKLQHTWLLLVVPEGTPAPLRSQEISLQVGSRINKGVGERFSFDRVAVGYFDLHIYSTFTGDLVHSILAIDVHTPEVPNPTPPSPSRFAGYYDAPKSLRINLFHDARLIDIDPTAGLPKVSLSVALEDAESDTSVIVQQLFENDGIQAWQTHMFASAGTIELPMLTSSLHLNIAATGYMPQELKSVDSDQTVTLQKGITASFAIVEPNLSDNEITEFQLYSVNDEKDGPTKARPAVPTVRLYGNQPTLVMIGSPGSYRIARDFKWPVSEAAGTGTPSPVTFTSMTEIIKPHVIDIQTHGQQVDLTFAKKPR